MKKITRLAKRMLGREFEDEYYILDGETLYMQDVNAFKTYKYTGINERIPVDWDSINKYIYGIDNTEDEDSPYYMYNNSIMKRVKQVSEQEAMEFLKQKYGTN